MNHKYKSCALVLCTYVLSLVMPPAACGMEDAVGVSQLAAEKKYDDVEIRLKQLSEDASLDEFKNNIFELVSLGKAELRKSNPSALEYEHAIRINRLLLGVKLNDIYKRYNLSKAQFGLADEILRYFWRKGQPENMKENIIMFLYDLLDNIDRRIVADYQPKQMASNAGTLILPPPSYVVETAEAKALREQREQERRSYEEEYLFNKEQYDLRRLEQKYDRFKATLIECGIIQEREVSDSTNENISTPPPQESAALESNQPSSVESEFTDLDEADQSPVSKSTTPWILSILVLGVLALAVFIFSKYRKNEIRKTKGSTKG